MDKKTLESTGWKTPNTYDSKIYALPPKRSGVYLIIKPEQVIPIGFEILYIGSSKDLAQRYSRHEVLRILTEAYGYVQFYFMLCDDYLNRERELILCHQPKYNKQWR